MSCGGENISLLVVIGVNLMWYFDWGKYSLGRIPLFDCGHVKGVE